MDDADWERLINQLRRGDCTPFLGAGACRPLPKGAELSLRYAHRYGYPFADVHNLARVMQYAEAVVRDPVDLKDGVCRLLRTYPPPAPDDPTDPHALLASFPLRVFLTTNYDDFLARALRAAGKDVVTDFSRWWDTDPTAPVLPEPTTGRPLVYHLHGTWAHPRSMVLTEGDYLSYLVNIVESSAIDWRHPLPSPVLDAMANRPLLFIGYSLQDWTFRVLFHGLARSTPRSNRRRHVSVQLMPEVNDSASDAVDKAKRYLVHYLNGWNISIFLGSAAEFCAELRRRMNAMP
ncbi:SIR2 family protein [Planomonospora corallina]|uniref:SIR2 family protein n=1 Tax=Planomonospora corallina TaxID=1806052 RepID=A0ABV8ICI6_9ACTN